MRVSVIAIICLLFFSQGAWADAESQYLVQACRDFVKIYNSKDETKPFAAFTASSQDALRAGYCRGVIAEYRRANHNACANDSAILIQANAISQDNTRRSVADLLRRSCGY